MIECPKHNGRFHLEDGSPARVPICRGLVTWPIEERGGRIWLNLKRPGGSGARSRQEKQTSNPASRADATSRTDTEKKCFSIPTAPPGIPCPTDFSAFIPGTVMPPCSADFTDGYPSRSHSREFSVVSERFLYFFGESHLLVFFVVSFVETEALATPACECRGGIRQSSRQSLRQSLGWGEMTCPFVVSLVVIFVETGAFAISHGNAGRRNPTKLATKIATKFLGGNPTKFELGGNGLPFVVSFVVFFVETGAQGHWNNFFKKVNCTRQNLNPRTQFKACCARKESQIQTLGERPFRALRVLRCDFTTKSAKSTKKERLEKSAVPEEECGRIPTKLATKIATKFFGEESDKARDKDCDKVFWGNPTKLATKIATKFFGGIRQSLGWVEMASPLSRALS